ncbi:MAG: hypothetical protein K9K76_11530 [Halanaerobiales bacterium]|nr:hypothetical protein [Halanaerobiales bacterium]
MKRKRYGELIPTDKEIFEFVHENYYLKFMNYDEEKNGTRIDKNYVPIDIYRRVPNILVLMKLQFYIIQKENMVYDIYAKSSQKSR